MRICSFLPSTTEIICALGSQNDLVGITHECDYPESILNKTRVVSSSINLNGLSSRETDEIVAKNARKGKSTYLVNLEQLEEADPDIIFTQGLCEVCAVSENQVIEATEKLKKRPEIISLEPGTVNEVLESIVTVGKVIGKAKEADELRAGLQKRIDDVRSVTQRKRDFPRVLCLEWLDPAYVAGHWVPDMVHIAGGKNGLREKGEVSVKIGWEQIVEFAPQYIFIMPCGFNIDKTLGEIDVITSRPEWYQTPASQNGNVYLVDANSYFSRPGPRLVSGIEIIAKTIHQNSFKLELPPDSILNLRNFMQIECFLG